METLVQEDANPKGNDFGVCLRERLHSKLFFELLLELMIVFNQAIMNQGNSLFVIKMGMSIDISLVSMSCPASVT